MKRFLSIIPIFLFMLMNACEGTPPAIPDNVGTAVAFTQTAKVWTPTISPTPDPNEAKMVEWLNTELTKADPLEQTLDATYHAVDVTFPMSTNGMAFAFRVDVRCECAASVNCCVPERMFVALILAMKGNADKFIKQVPASVGEVQVVCYDHMTQFNVVAARWQDVRDYLNDQINGYQLGARVYKRISP